MKRAILACMALVVCSCGTIDASYESSNVNNESGGDSSSLVSSFEDEIDESGLSSSSEPDSNSSADDSVFSSKSLIEPVGCFSISFNYSEDLENSFVFTGDTSFSLNKAECSNLSVLENNALVIGSSNEKGYLSFVVGKPISNISLLVSNTVQEDLRVRIGYINKSGIKIMLDPTKLEDSYFLEYASYYTATTILIEASSALSIKEIKMTLK